MAMSALKIPTRVAPNAGALYTLLGSRASQLREVAGLTQDEVALRVGISRASLVQFEGGHQRLPLETLYCVASALGVFIGDLFPTSGELSPPSEDVFKRIEADDNLTPESRRALTAFFKQAQALGGGSP